MGDQERGRERGPEAGSTELGAESLVFSPCSITGLLRDLGQVPCSLWASVAPFCNTRRLGVVDLKGSPSPDHLGFFRSPWKTKMSSLTEEIL